MTMRTHGKRRLSSCIAIVVILILLVTAFPMGAFASESVGVDPFDGRTTIDCSDTKSAAVLNDGSLYVWGYVYGVDSYKSYYYVPTKVMDNVDSVSCGGEFLALKKDHTLWTWEKGTPKKIMSDVKSVTSGEYNTAVIKLDDSLWMWGRATRGQLGNGVLSCEVDEPFKLMDDVASVSLSWGHTAVLKKDGTLWTCGAADAGRLGDGTYSQSQDRAVLKQVMDHVTRVEVGYNNTAAIKDDGSLWMFGSNSLGKTRISSSSVDYITLPEKQLDNVIDVSLGMSATAAVLDTGELLLWGYFKMEDRSYHFGTETIMPGEKAKEVSFGHRHILVSLEDNTLWSFGYNNSGSLGINNSNTGYYQNSPVQILNDVKFSKNLERDCAVVGNNLILSGSIGVNYFCKLSDRVLADENAKVVFSLPNGKSTEILVSEAPTRTVRGIECKVFGCQVTSTQMTGDISAKLVLSDGIESESFPYSVKTYADYLIANSVSSETFEKAVPLVKTMLNYGGYAQEYFQYDDSPLANENLTDEERLAIQKVSKEDVKNYEKEITGSCEGLTYLGSSLVLKSETCIRHYFYPDQGYDVSDFDFKVNGQSSIPVKTDEGYYVEIPNVASGDLDTIYTLIVGNLEIQYSALSYVYDILSGSIVDPDLNNTVKALYLYNQAANEYFQK